MKHGLLGVKFVQTHPTVPPGTNGVQVHPAPRYTRHTGSAGLSRFVGRELLLLNTETSIGDANKKIVMPAGL